MRRMLSLLSATLVVLVMSGSLWAQSAPSIPSGLLTANSLTAPDIRTLTDYVRYWIDRLVSEDDAQVVNARKMLVAPFLKGNAAFNAVYSSQLSPELTNGAGSKRVIVRINSMIIACKLVDNAATNVIKAGLKDANPAVRYWAGKAVVEHIAHRPSIPDPEQTDLLASLTEAMARNAADEREASSEVVEQLLVAMGGLTIDKATIGLLDSLRSRTVTLAAHPTAPVAADIRGMLNLYKRLLDSTTRGQPIPKDALPLMARVACRYMALMAEILDDKHVPQDKRSDQHQMLEKAEIVLRWSTTQMAQDMNAKLTKLPDKIEPLMASQNYKSIRLIAEEWRGVLASPPFNFSSSDLAIGVQAKPKPVTP